MEQWRDISGWEGWYEVSDKGRVRSLPRKSRAGSGTAFYRGKVLKASIAKNGYRVVSMTAPGGVRSYRYVHQLVLEAFIGPRPVGMEACHNNGIRKQNYLTNLRYDTPSGNARDRITHGRGPTGEHSRGEKNGLAKLNAKKVKYIRAHPEMTLERLASKYDVNLGTIWCARTGKTWRHV